LRTVIPLVAVTVLGACSDYDYSQIYVTDLFDQESEPPPSDVLFVIDDSSSMSEEQAVLQANAVVFADALVASGAPFHVGVITTDVSTDAAGVLRGAMLTPDTPDLAGTAAAAFAVGIGGSRDERGLQAAALALDGRNPDFHRDDAVVQIVVLSDEDDHSDGPVGDWLHSYHALAGGEGYALHAIVGDLPSGCASGTSAADPGARYLDAAAQTGGFVDSICADDYEAILGHVGLSVAGLLDTFVLSNFPDPDSIAVWVDSDVVAMDPANGWVYDPGGNAIVFTGTAVPTAGAAITVTYAPLAG
jgi:hypothetical protein